jgi:3-hydroxyisobutyrate dehydrogenase-like beta-hydroxyacid dehydrogenase
MTLKVAILAPGEMGAAVAARLGERGVSVTTSLAARSAASAERARRAGMTAVADDDALVAADFLLSICPPGEAVAVARRLVPALCRAGTKPVYVDCNAVSPATAREIGAVLAGTGCAYVDGGIIGPPPAARPSGTGTRVYVCGAAAGDVAAGLSQSDLPFVALDGPTGAASALKMSYAGITKGVTAIGVAMALGASHAGSAEALHRELELSQPELLAWIGRQVPRMYPKAWRFVAEMEEIGDFLGDGTPAGDMFAAIARLYQEIAGAARAGAPDAVARLNAFFETAGRGGSTIRLGNRDRIG